MSMASPAVFSCGSVRAVAERSFEPGGRNSGAASATSPNSVTSLICRNVSFRVLAPRTEESPLVARFGKVAAVGLAV